MYFISLSCFPFSVNANIELYWPRSCFWCRRGLCPGAENRHYWTVSASPCAAWPSRSRGWAWLSHSASAGTPSGLVPDIPTKDNIYRSYTQKWLKWFFIWHIHKCTHLVTDIPTRDCDKMIHNLFLHIQYI